MHNAEKLSRKEKAHDEGIFEARQGVQCGRVHADGRAKRIQNARAQFDGPVAHSLTRTRAAHLCCFTLRTHGLPGAPGLHGLAGVAGPRRRLPRDPGFLATPRLQVRRVVPELYSGVKILPKHLAAHCIGIRGGVGTGTCIGTRPSPDGHTFAENDACRLTRELVVLGHVGGLTMALHIEMDLNSH